jgi:uncharacterized protein YukJ
VSIPNYSVLKGNPQPGQVTGSHPHFGIPVQTGSGTFTVDVNVQSFDGSEVLYAIIQNFTPPHAAALLALPNGVTSLSCQPGAFARDYVRESINGAQMISRDAMTLLPIGDDIQDQVATNQAIQDENSALYAFGSSNADADGSSGTHNIHMNQGNPLNSHGQDNGIWQDGALFLYLPSQNQWIAVFLAFQTETWQTDDQGNPLGSLMVSA